MKGIVIELSANYNWERGNGDELITKDYNRAAALDYFARFQSVRFSNWRVRTGGGRKRRGLSPLSSQVTQWHASPLVSPRLKTRHKSAPRRRHWCAVKVLSTVVAAPLLSSFFPPRVRTCSPSSLTLLIRGERFSSNLSPRHIFHRYRRYSDPYVVDLCLAGKKRGRKERIRAWYSTSWRFLKIDSIDWIFIR